TLRDKVEEKYGRKNIIAASPQMRKVLDLVALVARTDSNVLIEGESGTGKELVANAIHFGGHRSSRPYLAINCGALSEHLLESELFGHVKGSFTGAVRDKKGIFEEADGGTLLLDEVGDMPLSLQVKLLRVLQEHVIRKVGSNGNVNVDVRILASTNQRLATLVNEGKFREDLFYRLKVVPVLIPPLRERKEDIVPLVDHFIAKYRTKLRKEVTGFTREAIQRLLQHDWPGNTRELENIVQGAMVLSTSPVLEESDVSALLDMNVGMQSARHHGAEQMALGAAHEQFERDYMVRALELTGWNQVETAKQLGIARSSLWRKMDRHGIKRPAGREIA
ncbi:MAG: sigma-54 dependent transcriptional regulator, partial [Spirochaetia bacterium]